MTNPPSPWPDASRESRSTRRRRTTQRLAGATLLLLFSVGISGGRALGITDRQAEGLRKKVRDSRAAWTGKETPETVRRRIGVAVNRARGLVGKKYDQTMGSDVTRYRNGEIVCVDVPRLSYEAAGIPMEEILRADARANPHRYAREGGRNLPTSPYFARRTRNWLRWCQENGRWLPPTATPRPGDVVFYGAYHTALVTEVDPDGSYRVVESAPTPGTTMEQYDWMVLMRGWKATGFGRILPLPPRYQAMARPPSSVVAPADLGEYALAQRVEDHPGISLITDMMKRLKARSSGEKLTPDERDARLALARRATARRTRALMASGAPPTSERTQARRTPEPIASAATGAPATPLDKALYRYASEDDAMYAEGPPRRRPSLWNRFTRTVSGLFEKATGWVRSRF